MSTAFKRVSTGVSGLDDMLGGGYPLNSIILISGGPGSGKTINSLQYTNEAISKGEPVVYINLEEPWENKKKYARVFGWDFDSAERKGLLLALDFQLMSSIDGIVQPRNRRIGASDFSLEQELVGSVKRMNAKHIIIDPLNSILVNARGSSEIRYLVHRIFETIRELKCTALITYEGVFDVDNFYSEMFLSDGVIALIKDIIKYETIKTLRIDKMRGIGFDDQSRRYTITGAGMVVFNEESVIV
jgi:KaiC/GvpD/RAD55 family RecA-like ATPase